MVVNMNGRLGLPYERCPAAMHCPTSLLRILQLSSIACTSRVFSWSCIFVVAYQKACPHTPIIPCKGWLIKKGLQQKSIWHICKQYTLNEKVLLPEVTLPRSLDLPPPPPPGLSPPLFPPEEEAICLQVEPARQLRAWLPNSGLQTLTEVGGIGGVAGEWVSKHHV